MIPFPAPRPRSELHARLRADIEAAIERLIAVLDELDGDPDREDGGDAEPSLGAPEGHVVQIGWARGGDADREADGVLVELTAHRARGAPPAVPPPPR